MSVAGLILFSGIESMILAYKSKFGKNMAFQVVKEDRFYREYGGKLFSIDVFNNVYLVGSDSEYVRKPDRWFRRGKTTYFGTIRSGDVCNPIHMGKLHRCE